MNKGISKNILLASLIGIFALFPYGFQGISLTDWSHLSFGPNFGYAANSDIKITEVEYDSIQSGNDGTYEWIELHNTGSDPVDIENWTISDGVATATLPTLVIPAGGYAVLANNPTNFQINYPSVTADIDLSPTVGLSNSGDTLTLVDNTATEIDFVAWEGASSGWNLAVFG